jgi:glycosyltransferase involved in cell wall biosynthesis
MSLPTVSVVVPLYNHERYVSAALESVFRQSLQPEEIIVVDDGSTDRSAAVVEACARGNPRVQLHRQDNRGAHDAINRGIAHSRGEIIAILNSDDAYAPDRLRACVELLARHQDFAAVATALSFMDDDGRPVRNAWYEAARAYYDNVRELGLALANGNFIMTTSNLVVRRSVLAELKGFKALRYAHDLDFLLRLVVAQKGIHLLERPLVHYRMHASNTIIEDHRKVRAEWASVMASFAHELFARREPGPETWQYYRALLDIAERHQLTRLIFMFLAFFATLPPGAAGADAFIHDSEFRRHILELA